MRMDRCGYQSCSGSGEIGPQKNFGRRRAVRDEPSIAPLLPALENDMQPAERQNDDTDRSPSGEISSSMARVSIFADRIEGRDNHDGELKRAADMASSAAAPQARADEVI